MDTFRKVTPGEGLSIPAEAYNAFVDAAIAERGGRFGGGANGVTFPERRGDVIRVRNDSGADLSQFDVVALGDPIVTPTELLAEFKRQIALGVTVPATGDEATWGVLLEPVPEDGYGRAVVAGVAIVQIAVTSGTASYTQAEITDGETTLVLSATGSAKVLWRESGTTGEKWAVVRLGATAAASTGAGDETSVAFPQTGRDYITLPSGGTYTYGRFRDVSAIADDTFYPACELVSPIRQTTSVTVNFVENAYYMVPFVAQRSTIQRLAIPAGQANNGGIRLAIYEDNYTQSGGGIHYPTNLVYETADLTWYEGDPQITLDYMGLNITPRISVSVTARAMYWMVFCYEYTTTYGQFHLVTAANLRATLGYVHRSASGGAPQSHLVCLAGLYYASGGVTEPALSYPDPFPGSAASPQAGVTYIIGGPLTDAAAVEIAPLVFVGYGA